MPRRLAVDDTEYLLLWGVLGSNLGEAPARLPPLFAPPPAPPPVALVGPSPGGSPRATLRLTWTMPAFTLELFHSPRRSLARPLAAVAVERFWMCYRADTAGGWHSAWTLPTVAFRDTRPQARDAPHAPPLLYGPYGPYGLYGPYEMHGPYGPNAPYESL